MFPHAMLEDMPLPFWRALGGLTLSIWVYLACFRGGFWRLRERLRAGSGGGVTVVAAIPARDEADFVGLAVRSLMAQKFGGELRTVVADDESSDGTAEVARAAGASGVARVGPRPAGWKGKLWAVATALEAAGDSVDYYLLTDADIEHHSREVVASLLAKAEEGFDLVSVMVRLRCESPAEKLLIPAFVFFFFKLYPPAWVAGRGKTAAAAGGCMLIRREMLERIGGIASIRSALIDDCALARRVKDEGGQVWLGISDLEIRSLRGYGDFGSIRTMISRAAFSQLKHSVWLLAGSVLGLVVTYIAPLLLVFSRDPVAVALGAIAWLVGALTMLPILRYYRAPLVTVLCLPAISAFYLAATVESAFRYWSGKGGLWKGRAQDEKPI